MNSTTGTARLWLPEPMVNLLIETEPWEFSPPTIAAASSRPVSSAQHWRGDRRKRLHAAGAQDDCEKAASFPSLTPRLSGTPQSPAGPITLVCEMSDSDQTQYFARRTGRRVRRPAPRLTGPREIHPRPRHALPLGINQDMNTTSPINRPIRRGLADRFPVTLTVELGRVSLTLTRLADLKAGDVLELGRHSREPVELTSNGRVVARGELVLIDTELGVRVTHFSLTKLRRGKPPGSSSAAPGSARPARRRPKCQAP